jgi:ABC-type phosphate/phosphonate transport system substrate-binding protein
MDTRQWIAALLLAAGIGQASAQSHAPVIFAVNEGVTYRVNPGATADRFRELADDLSRILKRPVKIQPVSDYKELATGLSEQRYDIAYVHPAHHSIRAMAKSGYKLVALTKGFTEYRASFLVPAASPLKTLTDLRGKVGAPDEDSITSVIMRATLREATGQMPEITYVRLQDAVPFMVEHGLVTSGVTASKAVVKDWQDKGGKVLFTSKPVPIKHMIASPKLPDAQREQLTAYFVGLDQSAEGKRRLEGLNVAGFVEFDQASLTGIGKWLGL